jgi:hypothetical protein
MVCKRLSVKRGAIGEGANPIISQTLLDRKLVDT